MNAKRPPKNPLPKPNCLDSINIPPHHCTFGFTHKVSNDLWVTEEEQNQDQEEDERPTAKTATETKSLGLHNIPPISNSGFIPLELARLSFFLHHNMLFQEMCYTCPGNFHPTDKQHRYVFLASNTFATGCLPADQSSLSRHARQNERVPGFLRIPFDFLSRHRKTAGLKSGKV